MTEDWELLNKMHDSINGFRAESKEAWQRVILALALNNSRYGGFTVGEARLIQSGDTQKACRTFQQRTGCCSMYALIKVLTYVTK